MGFRMAFVLSLLAVAAAPARACNQGSSNQGAKWAALAGLSAIGAVDLGFSAYDINRAGTGTPVSRDAAVVELMVAVPQIAGGAFTATKLSGQNRMAFALATIWPALLSTHAIWEIANQHAEPTPYYRAQARAAARVAFAPSVVADGDSWSAGVAAAGRW
jgi:hypothetical protein